MITVLPKRNFTKKRTDSIMDKFQKYLPQDTLKVVGLFWTEIMTGGNTVPTIWSLKHKKRRNH